MSETPCGFPFLSGELFSSRVFCKNFRHGTQWLIYGVLGQSVPGINSFIFMQFSATKLHPLWEILNPHWYHVYCMYQSPDIKFYAPSVDQVLLNINAKVMCPVTCDQLNIARWSLNQLQCIPLVSGPWELFRETEFVYSSNSSKCRLK